MIYVSVFTKHKLKILNFSATGASVNQQTLAAKSAVLCHPKLGNGLSTQYKKEHFLSFIIFSMISMEYQDP